MGLMEKSATMMIAPLILRNTVTSLLIYVHKSLLNLTRKYKFLEIIRILIISSFLFFIRLFSSRFPFNLDYLKPENDLSVYNFKPLTQNYHVVGSSIRTDDSGIARALSQLLRSVNDIPVGSRKYEMVRFLAERVIVENDREGIEALREVNRTVLSSAFSRTVCRVEAEMAEYMIGSVWVWLGWVSRTIRLAGGREDVSCFGNSSAEKLAAELLWLAQILAACGFGEEAVERWASASNLAQLSLIAEPRLQSSLVKVSAFLFKNSKCMGIGETKEANKERSRQTKMKMITSWLPLLCRASNGTDVPALSISEKAELEKILEDAVEMLRHDEQEQVLSLWLHHFSYCPSSDWPNLRGSYARWCTTSRKFFLFPPLKM